MHALFLQTLTSAWTLSWCRCWKVARSTCPSSMGLRLMSSGWIFSSRALTSHSCLCFTLRYGFASRPSKFGSPAPVDGNKSVMLFKIKKLMQSPNSLHCKKKNKSVIKVKWTMVRPGTSMLVNPSPCPTPRTSSNGQNCSPQTVPRTLWAM